MYLYDLFPTIPPPNPPSKTKARSHTGIMPELEKLADSNNVQSEVAGAKPRVSIVGEGDGDATDERSASRSPSIGEGRVCVGEGVLVRGD